MIAPSGTGGGARGRLAVALEERPRTRPDSPAAPYLPSLDRARAQGLLVARPFGLPLVGRGNLLDAEPAASLRLAAIQTTGELWRSGLGQTGAQPHDDTHVAGALTAFELPLRRELVALRARAPWPAALRLSLETTMASAGAYREAPVEQRRVFEGFDCDDAFQSARRHHERSAKAPGTLRWECQAYAIPLLLLFYRGLAWRRTVVLHALEGTVAILPPWAD